MSGRLYAGVGGWTFEPWRGSFYPVGLPQKRELEFASRALTAIEINGTYYSTFPPATWARWKEETPEGFVFSIKASRFATNRKRLPDAHVSVGKFLGQGLVELGEKLGPINWQLAPTKKFDPAEIDEFLSLLPGEIEGRPLRHAVEVRHESFACEHFIALARKHAVAIVHADSNDFPLIPADTAPFTYARIMRSRERIKQGYTNAELDQLALAARQWMRRGDAFVFFISSAKRRNPAAALAFLRRFRTSPVSPPKRQRR